MSTIPSSSGAGASGRRSFGNFNKEIEVRVPQGPRKPPRLTKFLITIYALQRLRDPHTQRSNESIAGNGKARAASPGDSDSSTSSEEAVSATLRPSASASPTVTQTVAYARKSDLGKGLNATKTGAFIKPQGFDGAPSKKRDRPQEVQQTPDVDDYQEEMVQVARAKRRAKKKVTEDKQHPVRMKGTSDDR
jgi:hypothetical protein